MYLPTSGSVEHSCCHYLICRSSHCWFTAGYRPVYSDSAGSLDASVISMKSSVISLSALSAFALLVQSEPLEPYFYLIYYTSDDCSSGFADTFQGFVSGNTFTAKGADELRCATETLCLINSNSIQCSALSNTIIGNANFTVNDDGSIYECDDSNSDIGLDECLLFGDCEPSSLYPSCHFSAHLKSELIQNPTLIYNPIPYPATRGQVYLVYHNDEACSDLAGLQSLIVGVTEIITTDNSVSCEESMACLIQPNGSTCQAIPNTIPVNISVETRNFGQDVFGCDGEGVCEVRDPHACVKSSIYPNCYYHIVSAVRLLGDPARYLAKNTAGADIPTSAPNRKSAGARTRTVASVVWIAILTLMYAW